MIFRLQGQAQAAQPQVVEGVRCPACKQVGVFQPLPIQDAQFQSQGGHTTVGERLCPNPQCRALLFVALRGAARLVTYPAERIDFDTSNIPETIVSALDEAISCHAHQCYVASAIMVRKALELLCVDRGATGANLKEKLQDLGGKVVLPRELFSGLDDLRLLGNDAAHIQSTAYEKVGEEEVAVAILFTKEVLKAVFQYATLLTQLRALKKP
jgi:Domain of unknown function (DUF4145)